MFSRNQAIFSSALASIHPLTALLIALAFSMLGVMPTRALAIERVRPDQESSVARAVFADQDLWLLSDAGRLSSFTEGRQQRHAVDFSEPVLDLCRNKNQPMLITGASGKDWTLRRRTNQTWSILKVISRDGDNFLAIHCADGAETILTSSRLIDVDKKGAIHATRLAGKLNHGTVTTFYDDGDAFFVGLDAGEWGGGLQRIRKGTGEVSFVQRNASGKPCGGPLNPDCDPVNGIVREPWNTNCLAVAIALMHMRKSGRMVEVCGDRIKQLYVRPYAADWSADDAKRFGPSGETVPFFGTTVSEGALWALGIDGLYRIDRNGSADIIPLPSFQTIDGFKVSFENPEMIVVMTGINERLSADWSTPMLVPR